MSDERVETVAELEAWARLAAPRSRWRLRRSQFPDRFVLEHSGIDLPLSETLYNHIRAAWTAAYGSSFGSRTPRAILALLDADAAARVRQAQGRYPVEPSEHRGACTHGVGIRTAGGLNCSKCGYWVADA